MHEAALARRIARALEADEAVHGSRPACLEVRGGHTDPDEFDAALRLHLAPLRPVGAPLPQIVHLPAERLCTACGETFLAATGEPCPACGGEALPDLGEETCRLVWEVVEPAEALP